ncbi:MAG: hypothetical protein ACOYBW_04695 [Fluviibacter phosphoraccumulans]|jgi:hypothetical protein|nr:hypothetical protein [Fluviibacter phosphoraccumulans]
MGYGDAAESAKPFNAAAHHISAQKFDISQRASKLINEAGEQK